MRTVSHILCCMNVLLVALWPHLQPQMELLVVVSEVPLSGGANLWSSSEFCTLGICFSYLWSLPLSYLAALLIDNVASLTGCRSLSVSPDCCYAFILEFLLSCLWLFFLSHTIRLNLTWPSASSGTSSFWQCFEHVQWGHDVDSDNHMFCVHAHWV